MRLGLGLVLSVLVSACGEDARPLVAEGCQPLLAGADCFLPYPSDFFRLADPALPAGARIVVPQVAQIHDQRGRAADLSDWRPLDGFSRTPTLVAVLGPVAKAGLPALADPPTRSLSPQSASVMVEASSGQLVAHFVDLDPRASKPERQAIVIHPLVGLKARTRYVVALQNLTRPDGSPVPVPEGFRRLRDQRPGGDPQLEKLAGRYESDVFAPLARAGVERAGLQLAWDFTTQSDEWVSADMLRVRELTLAWLAQNTPTVTIDQMTENGAAHIWRTVHGTITGPLFLTTNRPGAELYRGAGGEVVQNGMTSFPFLAQIPVSVRDQTGPGRVIGYGHGFFGSRDEIDGSSPRAIADRLRATLLSIDWWGMSTSDMGVVADKLVNDPARTLLFSERVPQAMANWMVTTAALRGPLLAQAAFQRPSGEPLWAGPPYFLGISQGHILGGVLAALHPEFARLCLNVGGAAFTHMMFRARPFSTFLAIITAAFPDPLDQQKLMASTQPWFDRIDPAFWAQYVLQNRLPGSPDRRLLLQIGLGDVSVPNLGSFLHARLLGLKLVTPTPRSVWGLEETTAPYDGSALTLYDFGIDTTTLYQDAEPAPEDNPVHEAVRLLEPALEQMDRFFRDGGPIVQPCMGPCDPT